MSFVYFSYFPKLPQEIQDDIWQYASLIPRTLSLACKLTGALSDHGSELTSICRCIEDQRFCELHFAGPKLQWSIRNPIPPLLHVTQRSRSCAIRYCDRLFPVAQPGEINAWINWTIDIVYLYISDKTLLSTDGRIVS